MTAVRFQALGEINTVLLQRVTAEIQIFFRFFHVAICGVKLPLMLISCSVYALSENMCQSFWVLSRQAFVKGDI